MLKLYIKIKCFLKRKINNIIFKISSILHKRILKLYFIHNGYKYKITFKKIKSKNIIKTINDDKIINILNSTKEIYLLNFKSIEKYAKKDNIIKFLSKLFSTTLNGIFELAPDVIVFETDDRSNEIFKNMSKSIWYKYYHNSNKSFLINNNI